MTAPWLPPERPQGAVQVRTPLLQQLLARQQEPTLLDSLVSAAGLPTFPLVTEGALDRAVIAESRYPRGRPSITMTNELGYPSEGQYSAQEVLKHEAGHLANWDTDKGRTVTETERTAEDWRAAFDLARDMTNAPQLEADRLWRRAPEGVRQEMMQIVRQQTGVFRGHPFLRGRNSQQAQQQEAEKAAAMAVAVPVLPQPHGQPQLAHRNNNPGNLKFHREGLHPGAQRNGVWAQFETPQQGMQALMNHLSRYQRQGLPIRAFVENYAPSSDNNDVDAYVAHLLRWFPGADEWGTSVEELPLDRFAEAVARHESGTRVERPSRETTTRPSTGGR